MKLIGFTGKIGSGKDTIAQCTGLLTDSCKYTIGANFFIKKEDVFSQNCYCTSTTLRFSDGINEICQLLTGLSSDYFVDRQLKELPIPDYCGDFTDSNGQQMTIRQMRQKVGHDALYLNFHQNVWINLFKQKLYSKKVIGKLEQDSVVLVPDVRMQNQVDFILQQGGIVIGVASPQQIQNTHEVENQQLEGIEHWIYNDKSHDLDIVLMDIVHILKLENIIPQNKNFGGVFK